MNRRHFMLKQFILLLFMYSFLFAVFALFIFDFEFLKKSTSLVGVGMTSLKAYWISCALYISMMTLCSTSYIGFAGITVFMTIRICTIVHSITILNYSMMFNALYLLSVFVQLLLELGIIYVMTYMSLSLSKETFSLVFFKKSNYAMKPLINYCLNYYLIVAICVFLSSLLKICQI